MLAHTESAANAAAIFAERNLRIVLLRSQDGVHAGATRMSLYG
jgi:hypothetical protein